MDRSRAQQRCGGYSRMDWAGCSMSRDTSNCHAFQRRRPPPHPPTASNVGNVGDVVEDIDLRNEGPSIGFTTMWGLCIQAPRYVYLQIVESKGCRAVALAIINSTFHIKRNPSPFPSEAYNGRGSDAFGLSDDAQKQLQERLICASRSHHNRPAAWVAWKHDEGSDEE